VRGAIGVAPGSMIYLSVDGIAVDSVPVIDDGPIGDLSSDVIGSYVVTADPGCTVRNGEGMLDETGVDDVEVTCNGFSTLSTLGISAPIDLAPAYLPSREAYDANASLLTQAMYLVPEKSYAAASIADVRLDQTMFASSPYGPMAVAGAASRLLRVETTHPDAAPHIYTLNIIVGAPVTFGYGKPSATSASALFGAAVAIDGDTLVVGAPGRESSRGAAYVYRRSHQTWTEAAVLVASNGAAGHRFGAAVAIAADRIIVGAPGVLGQVDIAGFAYVFARQTDGTWIEEHVLVADNAEEGDDFGVAVAATVDRFVVGAPGEDGRAGAAYTFGLDGIQDGYLKSMPVVAGAELGTSVAATTDWIAAGAPGEASTAGAVHVFDAAGTWTTALRVGDAADRLGDAVAIAITDPGETTLVAGAPGANGTGIAYVFETTGIWSPSPDRTLGSPMLAADDNFGAAVAIAGRVIAVGAFGDDSITGAAYLFEPSSDDPGETITTTDRDAGDQLGRALALSLDQLVVGAPGERSSTTGWNSTPNESAPNAGAVFSIR
jgi:hypothetical protein